MLSTVEDSNTNRTGFTRAALSTGGGAKSNFLALTRSSTHCAELIAESAFSIFMAGMT
jgi:hypothetical protein